jgi:hypothetical protein
MASVLKWMMTSLFILSLASAQVACAPSDPGGATAGEQTGELAVLDGETEIDLGSSSTSWWKPLRVDVQFEAELEGHDYVENIFLGVREGEKLEIHIVSGTGDVEIHNHNERPLVLRFKEGYLVDHE